MENVLLQPLARSRYRRQFQCFKLVLKLLSLFVWPFQYKSFLMEEKMKIESLMRSCACFSFIFMSVMVSGQINRNGQGFQLVKGQSVLEKVHTRQLGHLSPELVELGRLSKSQGKELSVQSHVEYGTPRMMTGLLSLPSQSGPSQIALNFTKSNRGILMLHPDDELVVAGVEDTHSSP